MRCRVLSIGQCGIDGPRIQSVLQERLQAQVDAAATSNEARARATSEPYDLVLVNRVLAFSGESGLEVVDELVRAGCKAPVMLVSDHAEAQEDAVRRGAARGFGKSRRQDDETTELLRRCVADRRGRGR